MGCAPHPGGAELFWWHRAFDPASDGSKVVTVSCACALLLGRAASTAPTEENRGLGKCDLQFPFTVALLITGIWDVLQQPSMFLKMCHC